MYKNTESRIAFLDAARAIAAILGVFLHSAAGYLKNPIEQWPRFCKQGNIFFDILCSGIHMIRIPIFFFLAGYFSYTLLMKTNVWFFIKNRCQRILMPLLIFMFIFHFQELLINIFFHRIHSFTDIYHIFFNMSYLWFLEYLCLFYLLFLIGVVLAKSMRKKWPITVNLVDKWLDTNWQWVFFVGANSIFLYCSGGWYWPIALSIVPNIWLVGIYTIYFFTGVLLATTPHFEKIFIFKWHSLILGLVLFGAYLVILFTLQRYEETRILAVLTYSAATYLFFTHFFAICLKFFSKINGIMQYLAYASYWIYLTNVFFIYWAYVLFARYLDSIYLQFIVVCLTSLSISGISYAFFNKKYRPLKLELKEKWQASV